MRWADVFFKVVSFLAWDESEPVSLSCSRFQNNTRLLCFRYVTYTSREDGHNLVIFQFYRHIYYKVSQPITEGGELRVCIGKDYATLLGIEMGKFTHSPMHAVEANFRIHISCFIPTLIFN